VHSFVSNEIEYYPLIAREPDSNMMTCTICHHKTNPADGKLSNMLKHIKSMHQDAFPYDDMTDIYKRGKEQFWDNLQKRKRCQKLQHLHPRRGTFHCLSGLLMLTSFLFFFVLQEGCCQRLLLPLTSKECSPCVG
jgi:hypothetical protein